MDFKSASEAVGLLGKLKEVKDNLTGKAEIKELRAQLEKKEQQLQETNSPLDGLGLSYQDLAIIAISAVAIVAIIGIAVVALKYPQAIIRA
jgi:hypothetical protein